MTHETKSRIVRHNILSVAKLAVKGLSDRACFTDLDDSTPEVVNFCTIVENIFFLGLKGDSGIFASDSRKHPWLLVATVTEHMSNSCVPMINRMKNLRNNFAKLRAWIRFALLEKRFLHYMNFLLKYPAQVSQYYTQDSIYLSIESRQYLNLLDDLGNINFSFDLKGEDLNHVGLIPIDYTPFLRFIQSRDDALELDVGIECTGHDQTEEHCPWKQEYSNLEGRAKAAAESNAFLEHLLQTKDKEMQLLEQDKSLSIHRLEVAQSEKEKFRVQLTLLHEQYRQTIKKLGGNPEQFSAHMELKKETANSEVSVLNQSSLPRSDKLVTIEASAATDHIVSVDNSTLTDLSNENHRDQTHESPNTTDTSMSTDPAVALTDMGVSTDPAAPLTDMGVSTDPAAPLTDMGVSTEPAAPLSEIGTQNKPDMVDFQSCLETADLVPTVEAGTSVDLIERQESVDKQVQTLEEDLDVTLVEAGTQETRSVENVASASEDLPVAEKEDDNQEDTTETDAPGTNNEEDQVPTDQ